MANWKARINISEEWMKTEKDEDNVKNLCIDIANKLEGLPANLKDDNLQIIIESFKEFDAQIFDLDYFDVLLYRLYNWADVDNRLWIDLMEVKINVSRTKRKSKNKIRKNILS